MEKWNLSNIVVTKMDGDIHTGVSGVVFFDSSNQVAGVQVKKADHFIFIPALQISEIRNS